MKKNTLSRFGLAKQQSFFSLITKAGKRCLTISVSLLLLVIAQTIHAKDMPGAAQTSYGVSNGGAFNFSLPIVIPQGRNGVQPNLSLNFSSSGGNGMMGQGWSLGGLGAITRCGKTIATEGKKSGVTHSYDDRFCLNGKKLILVQGLAYGEAYSEYRTEIDEISKVVASSTTVNNLNGGQVPTWFRVYRKDGMIYDYGLFAHGRQLANGSIHQWKLSSVRDRNNNRYDIAYYTDDYRPRFITYTHASGLVGDKKIDFVYDTRSDVRTRYIQSKKFTYSKRLDKINVTKGSTIVRQYNLDYEEAPISGKSRVTSITECGIGGDTTADDDCMPPVNVDWKTDARGYIAATTAGDKPRVAMIEYTDVTVGTGSTSTVISKQIDKGAWVDLDGDGRTDQLIAVTKPNGTTEYKAYLKQPNGAWSGNKSEWHLPKPLRNYSNAVTNHSTGRFQSNVVNQGQLIDVNGDGFVDVVYAYRYITTPQQYSSDNKVDVLETYLNKGDIDGDGLADGWKINPEPAWKPKDYIYDYTTNSDGNFRGETTRSRLIDLDGDGLVDWVSAWYNYTSGGNGIAYQTTWMNEGNGWGAANAGYKMPDVFVEFYAQNRLPHGEFVDVNGDGLVDWVQAYSKWEVSGSLGTYRNTWINEGDGWSANPDPIYALKDDIYTTQYGGWSDRAPTKTGSFVDVNGDGLRDWVRSFQPNSTAKLKATWLNNGRGWTRTTSYDTPFEQMDHTFTATGRNWPLNIRGVYQDINGDGLVDYVESYKSSATGFPTFKRAWQNTGSTWQVKTGSTWVPSDLYFDYSGRENAKSQFGSFVDINSDGAGDWVKTRSGVALGTSLKKLVRPDRIAKITTTMGVEIKPTFLPLTDNEDLYEKGTGAAQANSRHIAAPIYVTSKLQVSRADGSGINTTEYGYAGAQVNRLGRGFLGFQERTTKQLQKGIKTNQKFRQDYPFIGRKHRQEVTRYFSDGTPDRLISETDNTYSNRVTHDKNGIETQFIHMDTSTSKSFELNDGNQYRTVFTDLNYDEYGNLELNHVKTGITDTDASLVGEKLAEYYYYDADESDWFVGQLERNLIGHRAPGESNINNRDFFIYDSKGRLETKIREHESTDDSIKLTTEYDYDAYGNIIEERQISEDSSLDERFSGIDYDDTQHTLPLKVTNALGHESTVTEYHPYCDAPNSTTDANDIETTFTYDKFCREIKVETAGIWSETTYENLSCSTCQVSSSLSVKTQNKGELPIFTFFNSYGQPQVSRTQTMTLGWIEQRTEYDIFGRIERQSQPFFSDTDIPQWTSYTYDVLDRLFNTTLPFTTTIIRNRYAVDDYGRRTHTYIDSLGHTKATLTNALGQVSAIQDANSKWLQYFYDAQGNLIQTRDTAGNEINIEYDSLGRRIELDDPDMGVTEYKYNAYSETVWQKDAKNQVIETEYDQLGRMQKRIVPGTQSAGTSVWVYDSAPNGKGLLDYVSGPNSYLESYTYDNLSRMNGMTTTIKGVTFNQTMAYNANGFLASRRYPDSGGGQEMSVNYHYTYGYLSSITSGDPTSANCIEHWSADKYDALGRITQDTLGKIVNINRTFDQAQGVLDRIESTLLVNTGATVQELTYTYDDMNNVKSRSDDVLLTNETFEYDMLDRLTSYSDNDGITTVQYDDIGNITYKSDVGTYNYDGATGGPHALSKVTAAIGGQVFTDPMDKFKVNWEFGKVTKSTEVPTANGVHDDFKIQGKDFVYDANGNILVSGNRQVYWTATNMPYEIISNQPTIIDGQSNGQKFGSQIEYGPEDQRVHKKEVQFGAMGQVVAIKEQTTYVGKDYERITDKNGAVVHRYHIAAGNNAIQIEREDGTSVDKTSYMLTDALGSTNVILNANGDVEQRLGFDPWGMRTNVGDVTNVNALTNRGYTGHEMDAETGLINMNARIYDPYLGLFLSADTMVPDAYDMQAFNRYAYVINNPMKYTDPTGHSWSCTVGIYCDAWYDWYDDNGWDYNDPIEEIVVTGQRPDSSGCGNGCTSLDPGYTDPNTGGRPRGGGSGGGGGGGDGDGDGVGDAPAENDETAEDDNKQPEEIEDGSPTILGPLTVENGMTTSVNILPNFESDKVSHFELLSLQNNGATINGIVPFGGVYRAGAGLLAKIFGKAATQLSKSQLRGIRSLEKQIQNHQQKLDDFKANPTVRPGMENLPKGVIQRQQQARIKHLETEINTFRNNIDKIKNGGG